MFSVLCNDHVTSANETSLTSFSWKAATMHTPWHKDTQAKQLNENPWRKSHLRFFWHYLNSSFKTDILIVWAWETLLFHFIWISAQIFLFQRALPWLCFLKCYPPCHTMFTCCTFFYNAPCDFAMYYIFICLISAFPH